MFMSEKEFKDLVKKQPHLLKSQIDIKNTNKYKNVKLYEYKNGFVTTEKSFQGDKPVFVYDSIKEYNRWIELKNLERAVLPKSLSSVGEYAFDSCPMLVICGYSDTFSQKFAKENELEFLVIYDLPYTDVSLTDWFYQGAAFMYNNKLVAENDSKLFDPEKELTYADAVKLACAVYQLDRNINPSDNASYMAYALEIGIIQVDLSAKADNAISREDFVDILYNAMPKEKYGEINKLDGGAIPDVKDNEKILTFYRAGILTGCDNSGVFNPKSNIKRSEAATIIARMLDNAARQKFELG